MRFTPIKVGVYSYCFRIQRPNETIFSKTFSLKAIASNENGFIRLDPNSHYNFKFDRNGINIPFRALGENVAWADDYEYYFKKLNENGCNFARIWMCPWNLYLEWQEPGLGKYNLENAATLDNVFKLAEKYSIYLILCFDYHGIAQKEQGYFNENRWNENPYNSKNGGPCNVAAEIFTNSMAKKLYKNRIRYIVARYSYCANMLAWEFWNEVDLTAGNRIDIVAWHREMAAYLKQIDPYKHLITTSFSGDDYPEIWKIAEIDFSQSHHYNDPDMAVTLSDAIRKKNFKPHVIGEFGIDFRGTTETRNNDPDNIGFHNGLWAGFFSPTPIIPLTWWWDNIIDSDNLYFHLKAISEFSKDIMSNENLIQSINLDNVIIDSSSPDSKKLSDNFIIFPTKSWSKNTVSQFKIKSSGIDKNRDKVPAFLFGSEKSDLKQPPIFEINYKSSGKFIVHVNNVSTYGLLKIYLDDSLALEKSLPLDSGEGEWETSAWNKKWKIFQGRYNKKYSINVPAGPHSIKVENDGQDWIEIISYTFENCRITDTAIFQILSFQQKQNIFLWIRNEDYSWKKVKYYGLPQSIDNAFVNIPQLSSGTYLIEWWDTYLGNIFKKDTLNIGINDNPGIKIPECQKDIACKIIKFNNEY